MYDKKGATGGGGGEGGNGVGPGPAMLIAGIFPAPPTLSLSRSAHAPPLCPPLYIRVCTLLEKVVILFRP